MNVSGLLKFSQFKSIFFFFLMLLSSVLFSFSHAQQMFFHLLPGFTTPFTWVGLGSDANWTTVENWSTQAVPGASDTARFNDICVSNCNPNINTSITIGGILIQSTYAGTITQGAGNSIVVGGTAGWSQDGGIFNGSDSDITVSKFAISNGQFNSSSSWFTVQTSASVATNGSNVFSVSGAGATDFSLGKMRFLAGCNWLDCTNYSLQLGNAITTNELEFIFNEVSIQGYGFRWNLNAGDEITVINQLKMEVGTALGYQSVNNGQIFLNGNSLANTGANGGSTEIIFQSSGAQTYGGDGIHPRVRIQKAAGAVSSSTANAGLTSLSVVQGSFVAPAGILNLVANGDQIANGSTVFSISPGQTFSHNNGTLNIYAAISWTNSYGNVIDVDSSVNLNHLFLQASDPTSHGFTWTIAAGDTLNVLGNLTLGRLVASSTVGYNGGTINVTGNYSVGAGTTGGTTLINLIGTSSSISQASGAIPSSATTTISKPGATLTSGSNVNFGSTSQNLNLSQGTFNLAGFNLGVNSTLTVGAAARLICNGGTVTAGTWSVSGEVSCGTSIGITWTGLAGDNLWSSPNNWTNNTVPGPTDIAIFNNAVCVGANCNAQIDSNLSVRGIILQNTYTGILTQNATRTLTIGTAGFSQSGGTFAGGDSAIQMNGPYILSGGVFTSTSNTWTHTANFTISGAPTFNHNNSSLVFTQSATLSFNGVSIHNLSFANVSGPTFNLNASTVTVLGSLSVNIGGSCCGYSMLNNGTILAKGDVTYTSASGGTLLLKINGSGNQTVTGVSAGVVSNMEIDSSGGVVAFSGTVSVGGNWTYTNGSVDWGTSLLRLLYGGTIRPGLINYSDVYLGYSLSSPTFNLDGQTMFITGDFTLDNGGGCCGYSMVNNGTIEIKGDALFQSSSGGNALFKISGSGNQSITGVVSGNLPRFEIISTGGTVTMNGTIAVGGSAFTYTSGVVDWGTSTLFLKNSMTVIPGALIYGNVTLGASASNPIINFSAGTMDVAGSLLIDTGVSCCGGSQLNNGNILARGNVTASSATGGTATLQIAGSANQTITGFNSGYLPNVAMNSTGGTVSLEGTINIGGNFTYTAGTIDPGTSTLAFLRGSTIQPNGITLNHVTFGGDNATQNLSAQNINVNGTLTITDSGTGHINNGNIYANGSVVFSGWGKQGSAVLFYTGAVGSNLTLTGTPFLLNTNHVVQKSGGASLNLASNVSYSVAGRDLTIATGTLNLNSYDLTVNDVLTVDVGAILRCNGGEFTAGTITNNGTINCPGYATYDFNWTGAGGDPADWNMGVNWSGGIAPGANDIVVFQDTYCGATCDSTISTTQSARGVRIFSPYTGTITQATGAQFFIGSRGYQQAAGTFTGSNASISIQNGGTFNLTGGTFNSTSGTLSTSNWNAAGGTFNPNGGLVLIDPSTGTRTINHGTNQFHNLSLFGWATNYTLTGTVTVNNHFQFGTGSGSQTSMTSGVIEAKGDVTMVNNGLGAATNSTILRINGTGTQTLTGTGGALTSLEIDKASGTLNLIGSFSLYGPFSYISGTVNPGTSTLTFVTGTAARTHSPNGLTLANVVFSFLNSSSTTSLNNQTLNTTGTVTFSSSMPSTSLNSGTLNISGNANKSGTTSIGGTIALQFNGGTDGTLTTSGAGAFPGNVTINKPDASIILASNTLLNNAGQNLTISAGTLDMAGYNLTVGNNISNSGILQRGTNPSCGVISQGGSFTGNAAICP